MAEIDVLDRKILAILEADSSLPVKKIAKKVLKSPETTSNRIQQLQRKGIIHRCHAIVDMAKFGYETFRVYIRWQNMTLKEKEAFYNYLSKHEMVWTIAKLHGKWDVAFFVGVRKSNEFSKLWEEIEAQYKQSIAEHKIAIYSPIHNFNKKFMLDEEVPTLQRSTGLGEMITFDLMDERLARLYGNDVRQPLAKMAIELKVSIETVRKRIKRLELEGVFVGYKLDLNLAELGFQGYRVDFYLNSTHRNKELFEYFKHHKYFYQINDSIGGADFETEIVVISLVHLLEELEKVVQRFRDVIRNYEYFGYTGFPVLNMLAD